MFTFPTKNKKFRSFDAKKLIELASIQDYTTKSGVVRIGDSISGQKQMQEQQYLPKKKTKQPNSKQLVSSFKRFLN